MSFQHSMHNIKPGSLTIGNYLKNDGTVQLTYMETGLTKIQDIMKPFKHLSW